MASPEGCVHVAGKHLLGFPAWEAPRAGEALPYRTEGLARGTPAVLQTAALLVLLCSLFSGAGGAVDAHSCPAPFTCTDSFEEVVTPDPSRLCGPSPLGFSVPPCNDNSYRTLPLCNASTFDCADTGRVGCPAFPAGNATVVCLDPTQICDGKSDCYGGTDESAAWCTKGKPGAFNCTTAGKRWCPSGRGCVAEQYLCDGSTLPSAAQGCEDGSDESPSFCSKYSCPPVQPQVPDRIRCPSVAGKPNAKECISLSSLCDGIANCPQGQDENPTFCTRINCTAIGKRKCPSGVGCLLESAMCNGMVDCPAVGSAVTDEDASVCKAYNCSLTNRVPCPDASMCLYSETQYCDGIPDCPPRDWSNATLSSDEAPGFCSAYDCSKTGRIKCPGAASNHQCVDKAKFCDGVRDCPDGSDEDNTTCASFDCLATGRGQCKAGPPFCIGIASMCSGTANGTLPKQCIDGSDEGIASCKSFNCSVDGRVSCPSGIHCLDSAAALCNGILDCDDGSDEDPQVCRNFNCSATNRLICPSRVGCFPAGTQCDGNRDCLDGSDERASFCRRFSCRSIGAFKCPGRKRQCISPESVCDGVPDCADGSDERYKLCSHLPCSRLGKVRCPKLKGQPPQCAYQVSFCDGNPDCPGGGDEPPYTDCKKFSCPLGTIKCPLNDTCMPGLLCNGLPEDCRCSPGGFSYDEDPAFCTGYKCPDGNLKCKDNKECIQETSLCDGVNDCNDGSDEDRQFCSTYNCTADGRIPCPGGRGYCLQTSCSICDGIKDCPKVDGKYTSSGNSYYPDEDPQYCSLRSSSCPSVASISTS